MIETGERGRRKRRRADKERRDVRTDWEGRDVGKMDMYMKKVEGGGAVRRLGIGMLSRG